MKSYFVILLSLLFITAQAQNDGDVDVVRQMGEDEISQLEERIQNTEHVANAIDDAIGHFNTSWDIYNSAQEMYNASQALSQGECSPNFSTSNDAMLPSSCPRRGECADCYRTAVTQLNFVRRQLGRLSCIYNNTKNFTNSAIAFGDNASGIHAVTGLAWQSARREIESEFVHFKQTYDNKYTDLIGALERALKSIDRWESQYGQQGWFQRSVFIYLEFMKDKYRRED